MRAVEGDADLRVCAIPAEGPLSGFPHCLQRARAAGTKIETAGGQPVTFSGGKRAVLVRSPDGLLIELLEQQGAAAPSTGR